ncbi:DEAD-box ATP-dependent RNA helicase [Quillaja saponaria]|uniref:RNA helicase n=2 Tax=Quillaja saponaria TaxID=32244 RepID=A0AAD7L6W3_QUISA|nr:DEAD-box ATP-dependent RNA helicase [Quillaja saponaria]
MRRRKPNLGERYSEAHSNPASGNPTDFGKDVVARAKTGSGKTLAYLLPMLQKLFTNSAPRKKVAPNAFILVPTRELCQQVYKVVSSLIELCRIQLKVVQLTTNMGASDLAALAGPPDILVTTPACIPKCLSASVLQSASINESLETPVLDEVEIHDLLLSYGYENDIKAFTSHIPRSCHCLLIPQGWDNPQNVQQFWISCGARDKLLYILALLKLELVQKKALIFTNTIDLSFRVKLFLEKAAVLNAELPQNSCLHILEEFNVGLFDYLIATDDSQTMEKEEATKESNGESRKSRKHVRQKLDSEFGVVRGINIKNVYTEIVQSSCGKIASHFPLNRNINVYVRAQTFTSPNI